MDFQSTLLLVRSTKTWRRRSLITSIVMSNTWKAWMRFRKSYRKFINRRRLKRRKSRDIDLTTFL